MQNKLEVYYEDIQDTTLDLLENNKFISEVIINGAFVKDEHLARICNAPHITKLNLNNNKITDNGLRYILKLKNLKQLYLSCNKITDNGIKILQRLDSLESISLSKNNLGDRCIGFLPRNITQLDISQNQISYRAIKKINKLDKLKELDIGNTKIELLYLQELQKNINTLFLANNNMFNQTEILKKFSSLEKLCIKDEKLSASDMKNISFLPYLKNLSINCCEVENTKITLSKVEELDLSSNNRLVSFDARKVKFLYLIGYDLTDLCFNNINFPNLESLIIDESTVSYEQLLGLKGCSQLKYLDGVELSQKEKIKLSKELKNTKILCL